MIQIYNKIHEFVWSVLQDFMLCIRYDFSGSPGVFLTFLKKTVTTSTIIQILWRSTLFMLIVGFLFHYQMFLPGSATCSPRPGATQQTQCLGGSRRVYGQQQRKRLRFRESQCGFREIQVLFNNLPITGQKCRF